MTTKRVATLIIVVQMFVGQIPFVHADNPGETEGQPPCIDCGDKSRTTVIQRIPVENNNNDLLWGLGGLALGVGVGYMIWGNQNKNQYCQYPPCPPPYGPQYPPGPMPPQPPPWQTLSPAYGQVPYRPYIPYGPYAGGGMQGGGYSPYMGGQAPGLGNYQFRQPPNMLPPVWQ